MDEILAAMLKQYQQVVDLYRVRAHEMPDDECAKLWIELSELRKAIDDQRTVPNEVDLTKL